MSRLYNTGTSPSAVEAVRSIQKRKSTMYNKLSTTSKKKSLVNSKARVKSKTTSLAQARRSKHTGSEGEVAYGKRMY